MRERGWAGAVKRNFRFRTHPATSEDKVNRNFHVPGPNRLWLGDITEHHTAEGKVYCAVVLDAYSPLAIGWSIGSRMTADLVVDALQMARWRRFGVRGAIMRSDHGSQYTSWAFTSRVHEAGLIASMGSVGDCYDNAMMESFWSGMQIELLDSQPWQAGTGDGDVLLDRSLVEPTPPALLIGLPLPGGLRENRPDDSHPGSLTRHIKLSEEPGEDHLSSPFWSFLLSPRYPQPHYS